MNGEVHVALDTADFLAVFPLKGEGRARLVGTVRDDAEHQHEKLAWNDVSKRVIKWMHLGVERVKSRLTPEKQAEQFGPKLWTIDPNKCCELRKVEPLQKKLGQLDAWITGLRRDQ